MWLKNNKDFSILNRKINRQRLVYLDNAATTQRPKIVVDTLVDFYKNHNPNIHRGVHTLSEEATALYESVREKTANFINAKSKNEIIFTKNCTEAINLLAYTFGEENIEAGDEVIVSGFEHHANLVPWQELCLRKKANLKIVPISVDFTFDFKAFEKLLSKKTKLVAVTAISNVTGTILPIEKIIKAAHDVKAKVLVDAAQSIGHMPTDVQKTKVDFLAFSAHKMLGPFGVGVLYAKEDLLEGMPPFMFGGDMVQEVSDYNARYHLNYAKFEAGTQNVADVVAFGAALDYLKKYSLEKIQKHDRELLNYAVAQFSKFKNVVLFCPKSEKDRSSILSFTVRGIHPHDLASIFDQYGVAIRAGLHCAEPLVRRLGVPSTARMSFYFYNQKSDVDQAVKALRLALKIFKISE